MDGPFIIIDEQLQIAMQVHLLAAGGQHSQVRKLLGKPQSHRHLLRNQGVLGVLPVPQKDQRPAQYPTPYLDCDLYLFKEGLKPEWEDTSNSGGGFFKIRIEKKKSNRLWETSVFSMISPKNKYVDVMNGIRIKVRENFDELELWMNAGVADKEKLEGVKNYLKESTQITEDKAFNVIPFSSKK